MILMVMCFNMCMHLYVYICKSHFDITLTKVNTLKKKRTKERKKEKILLVYTSMHWPLGPQDKFPEFKMSFEFTPALLLHSCAISCGHHECDHVRCNSCQNRILLNRWANTTTGRNRRRRPQAQSIRHHRYLEITFNKLHLFQKQKSKHLPLGHMAAWREKWSLLYSLTCSWMLRQVGKDVHLLGIGKKGMGTSFFLFFFFSCFQSYGEDQ